MVLTCELCLFSRWGDDPTTPAKNKETQSNVREIDHRFFPLNFTTYFFDCIADHSIDCCKSFTKFGFS